MPQRDQGAVKTAVIQKLESFGYAPEEVDVIEKAKDVYLATVKLPDQVYDFHGVFTAEELGL